MRSQPPSGDSLGRVTCDPFVLPPSGGIPYAVAMPSMMVDLPLPFSPTRKVAMRQFQALAQQLGDGRDRRRPDRRVEDRLRVGVETTNGAVIEETAPFRHAAKATT